MARQTVEERFWSKARGDVSTRCHEWTASKFWDGYGMFWYEGKARKAHRVAWHLEHGQWPVHTLDHLCRNRACVNPDHLEDVPHDENVRRGEVGRYMADRTECVNGHKYTPENTGTQRNGAGRYCRTCKNETTRRNRARKRAEALEKALA